MIVEPHLSRSVELPERRSRPLYAITALSVLFAVGAYNYGTARRGPGGPRIVSLSFYTTPSEVAVVREDDAQVLCRTPCQITDTPGVTGFRLMAAGYEDRRVLVNTRGGDVRVDAVMIPTDR